MEWRAVTIMLLWSLDETARQLGGVSRRTVQRLLARGVLSFVHIGRRKLVVPESVQQYVGQLADNVRRAEPVALKGMTPCHTSAMNRRTGTQSSPMRRGKELDAVLSRLIGGKQKNSKQSGNSKPENSGCGVHSLPTLSKT